MPDLGQLASQADLGLIVIIALVVMVLQFLAAIVGPTLLAILTLLIVIGLAASAGSVGMAPPPPPSADITSEGYQQVAFLEIGLLILAVFLTYLIVRGLFRSMARATQSG